MSFLIIYAFKSNFNLLYLNKNIFLKSTFEILKSNTNVFYKNNFSKRPSFKNNSFNFFISNISKRYLLLDVQITFLKIKRILDGLLINTHARLININK